jgi:hypothetical protein
MTGMSHLSDIMKDVTIITTYDAKNIRDRATNILFTWLLPHVEQELLSLPEHLISLPNFGGDRVARSLVLSVMF